MAQFKCHACNERIVDGAWVTLTFQGFQTLRLNGVTLYAHARCVRLVFPDIDSAPLPPRVSDPVAEPEAWS